MSTSDPQNNERSFNAGSSDRGRDLTWAWTSLYLGDRVNSLSAGASQRIANKRTFRENRALGGSEPGLTNLRVGRELTWAY